MKYYNLQLLRFIAASAVIFFHKLRFGNTFLDFFISKGNFAVSLFFILSGFVVSASLLKSNKGFGDYFSRRFQKIYPQWLFSVAISILIAGQLYVEPYRLVLASALLQAVYPDYSFDVNFVGWSLSVEFLMYMVLFIVVVRMRTASFWFDVSVWIIWLITQLCFFYCLKHPPSANQVQFNWDFFLLYNPVWHLNEFLLGILISKHINRFSSFQWIKNRFATVMISSLFVISLAILFYAGYKIGLSDFYHNGFLAPFTGIYIAFLVAIEKARIQRDQTAYSINKLFDILGAVSFGMYLYHIPLYIFLDRVFGVGHGGFSFWIYYLSVIFFSWIAWLIFDKGLTFVLNKRRARKLNIVSS